MIMLKSNILLFSIISMLAFGMATPTLAIEPATARGAVNLDKMTAAALHYSNTATAEQLMTVQGIDDVKAKAIVDYRTTNGSFLTMSDLRKVPGLNTMSSSAFQALFDRLSYAR